MRRRSHDPLVLAEQAAAGLVTAAPDLARFVAAALPGPEGEPPGRTKPRRRPSSTGHDTSTGSLFRGPEGSMA